MGMYTQDELKQIHEMRRQEGVEEDRRKEEWNAAKTGFEEVETLYRIQYQLDNEPQWYSADPFYEPLSTHPDYTNDEDEAHRVAAELLNGTRGVTKQSDPGDQNITAVQIVENYSRATIISQTYT